MQSASSKWCARQPRADSQTVAPACIDQRDIAGIDHDIEPARFTKNADAEIERSLRSRAAGTRARKGSEVAGPSSSAGTLETAPCRCRAIACRCLVSSDRYRPASHPFPTDALRPTASSHLRRRPPGNVRSSGIPPASWSPSSRRCAASSASSVVIDSNGGRLCRSGRHAAMQFRSAEERTAGWLLIECPLSRSHIGVVDPRSRVSQTLGSRTQASAVSAEVLSSAVVAQALASSSLPPISDVSAPAVGSLGNIVVS